MKPNFMDMDPQEIRILMLRAGITQVEIARKLEVSPPHVNQVIDGLKVSDRVRRIIAESIGIDVKRIWPSAYLRTGGPRKPGRPRAVSPKYERAVNA